jgi:hypothetical protein
MFDFRIIFNVDFRFTSFKYAIKRFTKLIGEKQNGKKTVKI